MTRYQSRSWVDQAACAGQPEEVIEDFCADCPVKKQCLSNGLVNHRYETFGGLTAKERARWRRQNQERFARLVEKAYREGWLDLNYNCAPVDVLARLRKQEEARPNEQQETVTHWARPLSELLSNRSLLGSS